MNCQAGMHISQRMEQFSRAYVKAVAATAGFAVWSPNVDDDSVDIGILSREHGRPRIELQVKCTTNANITGPNLAFSIKRKNYDDLRLTNVLVPRILVVVIVPEDISSWLEWTDEYLLMRCKGYWASLRGQPERNQESVTIYIPLSQVFTVESLSLIMKRVADGGLP